MIDFIFNLTQGDVVYDIETYPNCITFYAIHSKTNKEWCFEFSEFKNETSLFIQFIDKLKNHNCRMVGFNNINFDYPVIHFWYMYHQWATYHDVFKKANEIITNYEDKFKHIIWDKDCIIPQIDLFKIHHFDNKARSVSLKVLEFNMRSKTIKDLPYKVSSNLSKNQIKELIKYNRHDVLETLKFYRHSLDKIKFRKELSEKYNKSFLNHNDTKIGKDYFITELEKKDPGCCYKNIDNKRQIVQTKRSSIALKDVIFPYISFKTPEFNRILTFLKNKTISDTKGIFKDVNCSINDFIFHFGTGGIHGSVENKIINHKLLFDDYIIEDLDVASYYPNLSIVNKLYPQHLSKNFCDIYKEMYEQRKKYKKGTPENAMLKLALNGVYGDSNNPYSPFYDPQYTMSITINGQLLLCMLAEWLMTEVKNKEIKLIQINTDGLTIMYHKSLYSDVFCIIKKWEKLTGLSLERSEYSRMFIRDVNNYIAKYTNGGIKRKGAYEYKLDWHQNHSMLIVPKAAEAYLLYNKDIKEFITTHDDIMDFMLRTKLRKSDILKWGDTIIQNTSRYYVSTEGDFLEKIMLPKGEIGKFKRKNGISDHYYHSILDEVGDEWDERIHTKNKSTYEKVNSYIHPGWTVQICNDLNGFTFNDINYDFYIKEAEKLTKKLESWV